MPSTALSVYSSTIPLANGYAWKMLGVIHGSSTSHPPRLTPLITSFYNQDISGEDGERHASNSLPNYSLLGQSIASSCILSTITVRPLQVGGPTGQQRRWWPRKAPLGRSRAASGCGNASAQGGLVVRTRFEQKVRGAKSEVVNLVTTTAANCSDRMCRR